MVCQRGDASRVHVSPQRNVQADLPARARAITSEAERREILSGLLEKLEGDWDVAAWVKDSPLVEVTLAMP